MMKKIIELAEKVVDLWGQPEEEKVVNQLAFAIIERQELEQTPITEDWLKEHGWKRDDEFDDEWWYRLTSDMYMDIILYPEYAQIRHTAMQLRSVAQLVDAMELCGITMN